MSENLVSAKRQMRIRAREALAGVRPEDAARWSDSLAKLLVASQEFNNARTILAFVPITGEPDIAAACDAALSKGKRLCLPRVDWDRKHMSAALVTGADATLVHSRHGLREPGPEAPVVDPAGIDLAIVPGIAFDESGRRLGRGGGYYDRFLSTLSVASIGVAFELQLVPEVPSGSQDIRVKAIVTERRLIRPG